MSRTDESPSPLDNKEKNFAFFLSKKTIFPLANGLILTNLVFLDCASRINLKTFRIALDIGLISFFMAGK